MVNPLDKMRLVSLFDGLGGFALAWCRATGQDPATFGYVSSDIEPYPMAVTRARFPRHIQLGDITQLEAPAILEALAELDAGEPGKPQTQTGADKNDDALRMARPGITISPDAGGVDPKHKRRRPRGKSTTTNKPGADKTGADAAQAQAGHLVPVISTAGDITHALTAKHGVTEDGNGRGTPLVAVDAPLDPEAAAYNIQTNDGGQHRRKDRPAGGMYVSETETDLTVGGTDSTRIVETPPDSFWDGGQVAECLSTNANLQSMPEKQRFPAVITHSAPATPTVRRLTPLECTRLMGYPDEWLDGIEAGSDAKKYRALGNSLAVPCVEWIFERLADFHREHAGPGGNK